MINIDIREKPKPPRPLVEDNTVLFPRQSEAHRFCAAVTVTPRGWMERSGGGDIRNNETGSESGSERGRDKQGSGREGAGY